MNPEDKQFHDKIASTVYKATRSDREAQTQHLSSKLDELKMPETLKVSLEGAELVTIKGAKGDTGDQGEVGLQGEQGEKGDTGADSMIPGPRGEQGLQGERGLQGEQGIQGLTGERGAQGLTGEQGESGSPDTAEDIINKIDGKLDIIQVKGVGDFGNNILAQAKGFVPNALRSLYDVNAHGVTDGQTLVWNNANKKWVPGAGGGGGGTYTAGTGLQLIGTQFSIDLTVVTLTGSQTLTNKSVNGVNLTTGGAATSYLNASGTYSVPTGTIYIGTTNRITVTGTTIDVASSYVGQASISTLGTITTGTWQGSVIAPAYLNIGGLVTAGTNVTVTGAGTTASPYVINSTASGSGSATPAGINTQIQFNDSGAFGASSLFTFNKTNGLQTIGGSLQINSNSLQAYGTDRGSYVVSNNAGYFVSSEIRNLQANGGSAFVMGNDTDNIGAAFFHNGSAVSLFSGPYGFSMLNFKAANLGLGTSATIDFNIDATHNIAIGYGITNQTEKLAVNGTFRTTGVNTLSNLSGSGTRMVVADPSGVISTQTIPSGGGGSGTVTSVSVVSSNGFAGTVATSTTTPAITLSTTVTGILKGNATAITAATPGTDYEVPLTFSTGLTRTTNTITVNTTQNISKLSNLTTNGFVKTSANDGTLIVDTSTYYPASNPNGYTSNTGTVTSVSVATANGVSGSVATSTTTPAITLTLGAITPSSVAATGTVTGSNLSGTNSGDQTTTGTAARITVTTGSTNPVIDIAATYVGQASITTLGTITTGTWQGTVIAGQYGGTGVANTGKTITLGGNLSTVGAFATTLTSTAATNITLPTTGTLATLAGNETLSNKIVNGVLLSNAVGAGSFLNGTGNYSVPAGAPVSSTTTVSNTVGSGTTRVNSTGPTTQTLPTTPATATTITIKNVNTGTVTVAGTIDGQTNYFLYSQYDFVTVQYNGSTWDIIGQN